MELKVAVRRVEDKLICRLKGVASFFFLEKKKEGCSHLNINWNLSIWRIYF
jgi:hypothetical protein